MWPAIEFEGESSTDTEEWLSQDLSGISWESMSSQSSTPPSDFSPYLASLSDYEVPTDYDSVTIEVSGTDTDDSGFHTPVNQVRSAPSVPPCIHEERKRARIVRELNE